MELDKFIQNFASIFENVSVESIDADTEFAYMDQWSSLSAVYIIAMVEDEYDVQINGDDVRQCETIGDLFELVESRL